MSKADPKSFKDLKEDELRRVALAFGADTEGNKDSLIASLAENGITWELYLEANNETEKDDNVVKSTDVLNPEVDEVEVSPEQVKTGERVEFSQADKYLIRMERKNPYFEFRQHKFTQENPFAIMTASDAQAILSTETGFRQAWPDEAREYFDQN